jgi:hypothetical protein
VKPLPLLFANLQEPWYLWKTLSLPTK